LLMLFAGGEDCVIPVFVAEKFGDVISPTGFTF